MGLEGGRLVLVKNLAAKLYTPVKIFGHVINHPDMLAAHDFLACDFCCAKSDKKVCKICRPNISGGMTISRSTEYLQHHSSSTLPAVNIHFSEPGNMRRAPWVQQNNAKVRKQGRKELSGSVSYLLSLILSKYDEWKHTHVLSLRGRKEREKEALSRR